MPLVKAVATLPVNDPKVAAAALRGRLRLIVDRSGGEADWDTLAIAEPTAYRDARGGEWFDWVATVLVHESTEELPTEEDPPATRPSVADLGILPRRTG